MSKLEAELKHIKIAILLLGFNTIIVQLLFIREFLAVFNGNELIIAIVIANWMGLTGLGAYLRKKINQIKFQNSFYSDSLLLLSIIPFISIFLLYFLKNMIFPLGSMVSVVQIFIFSLFLLAPYCLLSGFLYTSYSVEYSKLTYGNKIAYTYSLEGAGSILGGIVFSFLITYFLSTCQALELLFFGSGIVAFFLRYRRKTTLSIVCIVLISIIIPAICFLFDIDKHFKQFLFSNQVIVRTIESPYGSIVETRSDNQNNIFGNGLLLFSSNNTIQDEELVHYAMVQHKDPKDILVISGGTPGMIKEILKYNVNKIVFTEINPGIIRMLKDEGAFADIQIITTVNKDARQYIRQTHEKFDVVLINLPPPDNFQINRYYSGEFLLLLKKVLNPDGIVRYCLPSTINYVSKEAAGVNSILYNTLKQQFRNVLIIPGELNYFLASDTSLSLHICELVQEKQIKNEYVNKFYLNDKDIRERSSYILSQLGDTSIINSDFLPISYFRQIIY